jgi:amino acid adenylation domain-containing protein/non-ribosomal peptide synthase protein (TIGR01720 family)
MDVQIKTSSRHKQKIFEFGKQNTSQLEMVNKAYNTETRELLLAALAMSISNWTKEEKTLINVETDGRQERQEDIDAARTIGCFSTQYPIILTNYAHIADTIKNTKDMLRNIPDSGMSYGLAKYLSEKKLNVNLKPEIHFTYLRREYPLKNNSMFQAVKLSNGRAVYPLTILGIITEGSLKVSFTYSNEEFNDGTMEGLMEFYKDSLLLIINHCLKKEDRVVAASDLTDEDITLEELRAYQNSLSNIKSIYPLAPMQEGMLYHTLLEKDDPYNIVSSIQLEGPVDEKILEQAFNKVIDRHDILRTVFDYFSFKQSMQVVFNKRKAEVEFLDLTNQYKQKEKLVDDLIKQQKQDRFNLSADILIKLTLVKTEEKRYYIIFNAHHILMDGWCFGIIVHELFSIYNELKYGIPANLEDGKPYADYIAWLKTKDLEGAKEYWRSTLEEINHPVKLPFGRENKGNETVKQELSLTLDKKQTRSMEELAQKHKVSLNMVLQSIWAILLHKYGNNNIVYGYVVSGRSPELEGAENILGLFINTVPLSVSVKDNTQFTELLQAVRGRILKNSQYDYLSLAEIQNVSKLKNDLINCLFVFENFPLDEGELKEEIERNNELALSSDNHSIFRSTVIDETNYDFTVVVTPNKEMEIKFLYNEKTYRTEDVSKIMNSFENLMDQIVQNSMVKIQDIQLDNPEEKHKLLVSFNDTKTAYPKNNTVAELFEKQVKKTPDHTAVVFENKRLTYEELNREANKLAHTLREEGIEKEHIVGIMVEKSLEMVIGTLAILKAGAAYLPIDPAYPEDRINYLLHDGNVQMLLADEENWNALLAVPKLLDITQNSAYTDRINDPEIINDAASRAYVIYTSGTTGNPKGVEITQKSIARLVKETNYVDIKEDDRLLQTGSITFDASTFEIWGPLLNGAALYLANQDTILDYDLLEEFLKANKITTMFLTPALFHKVTEVNPAIFSELRTLLVGGDVLYPKYVNKALKAAADLMIINGYGPTENTTFSTAYCMSSPVNEDKTIPIGAPISNTTAYILDSNFELVSVGMEGELCLSGDGLAAGYLNKEELTKEKFVDNPFLPGQKMYQTGDKARWLPDGNIEYLGRMDQQVKIRGFRIEPGEIENALLKLQGVKEAAVVSRGEQGDKYLCAYYSSEIDYDPEEMKDELKKHLPDYMIPAWIIKMASLPLTLNGKIDKKQLPLPGKHKKIDSHDDVTGNEAEQIIASVWRNVLGVNRVSINEKFFSLGGDSIKAIQIIARIRNEGYDVELKDLVGNPTIKELSGKVKQNDREIDQGEVTGEVNLTPIQQWFFQQNKLVKHHFNQELMLFSEEGFNQQWLQQAFETIIKHHDILRAVFTDGKQRIKETSEKLYDLVVHHLTGRDVNKEEIHDLCSDIQASMDLEKGPLVKLGLFKTDKGDHLLIAIHHLIVDTVSWRIIVEDFDRIYHGLKFKQKAVLPAKTTSFKEWSTKQKDFADSYQMKRELAFWKNLNTHDWKKPKQQKESQKLHGHTMRTKTAVLDKGSTDKLLIEVNSAYSTEINDIILAALTLTLGKFNQTNQIVLNLESHGREQIVKDVDITRTVGWFTSQYPVVLNKFEHLGELIAGTKDALRKVPNKGIGYGILKYLTEYDLGEIIEPDVSFNYLGQFDHIISGENFTLSDLSGGISTSKDSIRLYPLDFVAFIAYGEFNLTLNYSSEEFSDTAIDQLLQDYMNSVKSIISHCISKEQVEVTVSDITDEAITPVQLQSYQDAMDNIQSIYPLSPLQEGLFFHSLSESGEAYHVSMQLSLTGDLDVGLMDKSFQDLTARHDVFRTSFDSSHFYKNMQVVYKNRIPELQYFDISEMKGNKARYIHKLLQKDRKRGFDLSKDLLIRLYVIKLAENEFSLILSNHHIILDGWSFGIITRELFRIYNSYKAGAPQLTEKAVPYQKYIEWLENQDKEKAVGFWKDYLTGYNNHIEIPFKKSSVSQGKSRDLVWRLGKEKTNQLNAFARSNNVTVNTILQSIWAIQLQRYNNVRDIVFGFIVSGRTTEINQIDEMVGLFINTVPLRVNTTKEKRYTEIIKKMKADLEENEPYRYVSMAEIQKHTEVKSGLINTLMVFENYPIDKNLINEGILEETGLQIGEFTSIEETNYSFNLKVISGDELVIAFDYNDGVYDRETAGMVKHHFAGILEQIMENPKIGIDELELLENDERNVLLEDFNSMNVPLDKKATIQGLFDYHVKKNPDKPAIVYGGQKMSYGELNRKANSLAKLLRTKGIGPETIVPVMAERSFEMVIGILAVLKAGAAYLPIDAEYPEARINYMLSDSGAQMLLTTRKSLQKRDLAVGEFIYLEDEERYAIEVEEIDNKSNLNSLAYVIYTSGTTGKPKGVMLEQRGVINLTNWFKQELGINGNENILQFASIAFDAFSWELNMTLLLGNTFYIPEKDVITSPDLFNDYIKTNQITTVTLPPFVAAELDADNGLQKVIVAGSEVKMNQISHLLKKMKVINAYGPTEDTVCTTFYPISDESKGSIPIGRPISNHRVVILDEDHKLVPAGVEGELCISGAGIARGYLNNKSLTRKKFIENPYRNNETLYKTGDVARWKPDGNIEYLGRMDHQVKIRGFRIEMSEIEQQMLDISFISQVAIADKEINGMKYICAYFVSEHEISVADLRERLRKTLPNYMIPSYFIRLESLPFTINGKVDREKLPDIETNIQTTASKDEEVHEAEQTIKEICQKVLGLKQIGVQDNLFELGADSIRIAKIYTELRKLNFDISIKDLFYYETIRSIYLNCIVPDLPAIQTEKENAAVVYTGINEIKQHLTKQINEFNDMILSVEATKVFPASSIQKITWETNRTFSGAIMEFNHHVNVELLKKSIISVINKQGLLRTKLVMPDGKMEMEEHGMPEHLNIPYVNLENTTGKVKKQAIDFIVDKLYQENVESKDKMLHQLLYKVIIVKLDHERYKIYMPFNHLIFDGMSMEIIKANIKKAYADSGEFLEEVTGYDTYVRQVLSGPKDISEEELMEKFHLHDFWKSIKMYNQAFKNRSFRNTAISLELSKDIYEQIKENAWEVSLNIFQIILESSFDMEKVPFVMMYQDRKDKVNNYYNTVGEFLDVLPLVIKKGEKFDLTKVHNFINLACEKNINFSTLLENKDFEKQYKSISKALKGTYTNAIQVPIFNYSAIYDSKAEDEQLGAEQGELSTEINVALHEGGLKIHLFCEEEKKTVIREALQKYVHYLDSTVTMEPK